MPCLIPHVHTGHMEASCPYPSYSLKGSKHTRTPQILSCLWVEFNSTPGARSCTPGLVGFWGGRVLSARQVWAYRAMGKAGWDQVKDAQPVWTGSEMLHESPGSSRGCTHILQLPSSGNSFLHHPTAHHSQLMLKQLPSSVSHPPLSSNAKKKPHQTRIVLRNSPPTHKTGSYGRS